MCCEAMSVVEEEEFENGASGKGGTRFSPEAAKTKWIRSTKDFDFDGRQHQPTGHQTQRPLKGNAQLPAGAWRSGGPGPFELKCAGARKCSVSMSLALPALWSNWPGLVGPAFGP